MLLASSMLLLGMRETLPDCRSVATTAFLVLSLFVPMLNVSLLSAMLRGLTHQELLV